MARRKVVFVIVEGASDEIALGIALNQIFDKESVHVHIMHGDITTRSGVNSQNIVAKVGNEVKEYATSNHYKPTDFKDFWGFIENDMHSIERYTNLPVCLEEEMRENQKP